MLDVEIYASPLLHVPVGSMCSKDHSLCLYYRFFFLESVGELRIKYIKKGKKRSKMDQLQENLLTEARI